MRFEPTEYRDHRAWLSLDPQVLLGAPHGNLRRRPGIPWSRFGLFPFLLILVVLLGALGVPDLFDKAVDEAQTRSSQYVPRQLEPPLWLEGFPRQRRILWLISWCWLP